MGGRGVRGEGGFSMLLDLIIEKPNYFSQVRKARETSEAASMKSGGELTSNSRCAFADQSLIVAWDEKPCWQMKPLMGLNNLHSFQPTLRG